MICVVDSVIHIAVFETDNRNAHLSQVYQRFNIIITVTSSVASK